MRILALLAGGPVDRMTITRLLGCSQRCAYERVRVLRALGLVRMRLVPKASPVVLTEAGRFALASQKVKI
jgi:Mn-dependent DtxR family transcriptional regulator